MAGQSIDPDEPFRPLSSDEYAKLFQDAMNRAQARYHARQQQAQRPFQSVFDSIFNEEDIRKASAPAGGATTVPFRSLDEMMGRLDQVKDRIRPVKPPISREERIHQIEQELDIIRGRVPTPQGYVVNIGRAKELMIELKRLQSPQP